MWTTPERILILFTAISVNGVNCQEMEVSTPAGDRVAGFPIDIEARYNSLPADPVQWSRLSNVPIGSCQPGVGCDKIPGYVLYQSADGLTYFLHINRSSVAEHKGVFTIIDDNGIGSTTELELKADPASIGVTCDQQSYLLVETMPADVTCTTACTDENIVLSFAIENSTYNRSSSLSDPSGCPGGETQHSVTARLIPSVSGPGNKTLCYRISSGERVHEQSTCLTVEFRESVTTLLTTSSEQETTSYDYVTHTDVTSSSHATNTLVDNTVSYSEPPITSGPTELPTTSPTDPPTSGPTVSPPKKCCDSTLCCDNTLKIAFLVIGCLVLLLHAGFIVAVTCTGQKRDLKGTSRCPAWVCPVLLVTGIVFSLVTIVVLAVSFGYEDDQCICRELVITGIVFAVISILIWIVVATLIFCLKKSRNVTENHNKPAHVAMERRTGSVS